MKNRLEVENKLTNNYPITITIILPNSFSCGYGKILKNLKKNFLFFAAVNSICRLHWKMSQYWIMDNIKLVTFTPHLNAERNSLFPAHVIILTPKKRRERSRQIVALGLNFFGKKLQWKRILCDLYFIWFKTEMFEIR